MGEGKLGGKKGRRGIPMSFYPILASFGYLTKTFGKSV